MDLTHCYYREVVSTARSRLRHWPPEQVKEGEALQEAALPGLLHRERRLPLEATLQDGQVRRRRRQRSLRDLRRQQDHPAQDPLRLQKRQEVQEGGGDYPKVRQAEIFHLLPRVGQQLTEFV